VSIYLFICTERGREGERESANEKEGKREREKERKREREKETGNKVFKRNETGETHILSFLYI